MRKLGNISDIKFCFLWVILSFICVYLTEVTISPRYEAFYGDCSVFKTMARAWANGLVPYKDIFDHKGPYLYLINVIGLFLSEKWGLFLLSSLNLSISAIFLWLIGRLRMNLTQTFLCVLIFLGCYVCVNNGGNMTESWSLPFSIIPLYLYCSDCIYKHRTVWYNFIYGLCFGIISLVRVNNGIIPAAIMLTLFIIALKNRDWKVAAKQIILQISGFLVAFLPIAIYFYLKESLYEFVYACYIFNLEYMSKWPFIVGATSSSMSQHIITNLSWLIPVFLLLILSINDIVKRRTNTSLMLMVAIASFVTILTTWRGISYLHYYISFLPLIYMLLISIFVVKGNKIRKNVLNSIIFLLTIIWIIVIPLTSFAYCSIQICKDICKYGILHDVEKNQSITELTNMLQRDLSVKDIDNIYIMGSYDCLASLVSMSKYPTGKYFFLQPKLYKVSDKVSFEIDNYHKNVRPQFILTDKHAIEENCGSFNEMLNYYQKADSTSNSQYLFKLKK